MANIYGTVAGLMNLFEAASLMLFFWVTLLLSFLLRKRKVLGSAVFGRVAFGVVRGEMFAG